MNPRQIAIATVRAQLGLDTRQPSDWTYDERVNYNRELAKYLLEHPTDFTPTDLASAQDVQNEQNAPLADDSVSANLSAFGSAFTDELVKAGGQVAGIGQGVLTAASLAAYVIPIAGLIVVGVLLWQFSKTNHFAK